MTVMRGSRLKDWKTMPMVRLRWRESSMGVMAPSSRPRTKTEPEVGWSSPASRFSSEDLPGAGCAQNGHEIAGVDVERDAVDGADGGAAHLVVACEVFDADGGAVTVAGIDGRLGGGGLRAGG